MALKKYGEQMQEREAHVAQLWHFLLIACRSYCHAMKKKVSLCPERAGRGGTITFPGAWRAERSGSIIFTILQRQGGDAGSEV